MKKTKISGVADDKIETRPDVGKADPAKKIKRRRRRMYFFIVLAGLLCAGAVWLVSTLTGGLSIDDPTVTPAGNDLQDDRTIDVNGDGGRVRKEGFYLFLAVGTDKSSSNTDTILLSAFDTENDKLYILQIPRDSQLNVTNRKVKKINASYAYGGIELLESDLTDFLGLPVDRYAIINLNCFRTMVDLVGGVQVTVPEPGMDYEDEYQNLSIHLDPGLQTLNGTQAEGFVRYRKGYADADIGRLKAQRAFISSFMEKLLSTQSATKIPQLVKAVYDNLKTDCGLEDMIYLANQAFQLDSEDILFFTLPGEGLAANWGVYENETLEILNQYFNPYTTPLTEDDLDMPTFTRQSESYADQGVDLSDATDTTLSKIHSGSSSSSSSGSSSSSSVDTVTPDQNITPGDTEASGETEETTETTADPGSATDPGQTTDPGTTATDSGIQVELVNASGDASVLAAFTKKLEKAGCVVVQSRTAAAVLNGSSIINRTSDQKGTALTSILPSANYYDSYQAGTIEVTIILGSDVV